MSKRVKVAVVGCGFIGEYHARSVLNCAEATLVAAADSDGEKLGTFARRFGVPVTTADPEVLLGDPDIDAVAIGVPNAYHKPLAVRFLDAGKHVLLEKPMATSAADAYDIMAAAERNDRRLLIGHMWRFDPEAQYVRQAIRDGLLGDVVKTKGYGIHALWGPNGWFTEKRLAGGGALADMGVHAIDTVRYLLGDPKPVSVYARIGTHYGDYDVDDSGVIIIEWDTGTTSIVESGWWQPHTDGPEASTQVFGKDGYARLFPTELRVKVGGRPGVFSPEVRERDEHCAQFIYDAQMDHFVDCIQRGKTPRPGGEEGLAVMKIVDAAYLSAQRGEVVRIVD